MDSLEFGLKLFCQVLITFFPLSRVKSSVNIFVPVYENTTLQHQSFTFLYLGKFVSFVDSLSFQRREIKLPQDKCKNSLWSFLSSSVLEG